MFRNLRDFINVLKSERQLVEVNTTVDPHLEVAEIHRRVIAEGGPALLFTNVRGAAFPLVTNLFGTKARIERAFGADPEKVVRQLAQLPERMMPPTLKKLWDHRGLLGRALNIGMRHVSTAPVCQEIQQPARLGSLPLLTTWEEDGGAFVTLPLVYTEHPETHVHNLGMYRLQRFDDESTGFHCQIGKGGGFHLAEAARLGIKLPVNVAIGGPPALILSAIAPLPENVPELLLASLVMNDRVRLAENPLGPLPVLADAEFILVGEVDPTERKPEGPFGDHYGYYSLKHDYPVLRLKGLLHRSDAICAATVVGKPKQEDFFLGDYLQELLSPLFPLVMPAVKDLWSYGETGYHSLAAAVVKQRYKREAMASAFRILGEGQLSLTKFLLVLDRERNLRDFRSVLEHILARADFRSDLYVFSNLSMDTLDYTGPTVNEGSKGVLLGVGEPIRALPHEYVGTTPHGVEMIECFCGGCLVVSGRSHEEDPALAHRIARHDDFQAWPLVIVVDDAKKATRSESEFLWTTFTRFEPAADIYSANKSVVRNHIAYEGSVVIDARMKLPYPGELSCDAETAKLVDSRWSEYFPKPHG